jgi:hypothetical protein
VTVVKVPLSSKRADRSVCASKLLSQPCRCTSVGTANHIRELYRISRHQSSQEIRLGILWEDEECAAWSAGSASMQAQEFSRVPQGVALQIAGVTFRGCAARDARTFDSGSINYAGERAIRDPN